MNAREFQRIVDRHRADLKLSNEKLAQRIGVSAITVYNHRANPNQMNVEVFGRYARVLHLSQDEIKKMIGISQ